MEKTARCEVLRAILYLPFSILAAYGIRACQAGALA